MIRQRAPWFDGSIEGFRWRMIVRFEKRLAECFGRDRVWLAGDAGHLTGPVGMQSMNIGISEGHQLGDILADLIEGKADVDALAAYGNGREQEWRALMGMDIRLEATESTHPLIAANLERLPACLPASQSTLPALAQALGVRVMPQ